MSGRLEVIDLAAHGSGSLAPQEQMQLQLQLLSLRASQRPAESASAGALSFWLDAGLSCIQKQARGPALSEQHLLAVRSSLSALAWHCGLTEELAAAGAYNGGAAALNLMAGPATLGRA